MSDVTDTEIDTQDPALEPLEGNPPTTSELETEATSLRTTSRNFWTSPTWTATSTSIPVAVVLTFL
jgi:hypothetical protein